MTLRVCVAGAGIGAQHCRGYSELPGRFSVHSVCDLDEDRGRPLAEEFGASFTNDLAAAIADPEIDVLDVCLPPHAHFRTCMEALDAGKIVICEKPLACSLSEADALAAKVAETGGQLFPVFQYRYGIGTAQAQALIDAGLAGTFYAGTLETHWDRPSAYYDVAWRGTWTGERGGAVLGHAIHIHDLLVMLTGPFASVHAETAIRVNDIEVEDCAALAIRMESGAVVTSSVTLGCAGNVSRLRLMFEGFTAESDHAAYSPARQPWRFLARAPTKQSEVDSVLAEVGPVPNGYAGFFDAIGGGGPAVTLDDGRRSLEFVTAVYQSSRTCRPATIPIGKDHPLYCGWLP